MDSASDTNILIVGAGPVGLALAVDLGWRGVPATIIEQDLPDARSQSPRMDNVSIRTMEFCRRWGLVEAVENAGFPRDSPMSIVYATAVLGHELARDEYPEKRHAQSPPFSPSKHELCPQNYFDPVMQRAALAYTTNRLLFSHRLVRLNQTRDSAVAEVEDAQSGKTKVVRRPTCPVRPWLRAADGSLRPCGCKHS